MDRVVTLAAGCFWGVEDALMKEEGVLETEVGYTGGWSPDPTYREVCMGNSGHAEAVKVTFDPDRVSLERLMEVFFELHDAGRGSRSDQYRSSVFVQDQVQREKVEKVLEKEGIRTGNKLATRIEEAGPWWRAEEYHQKYEQKARGERRQYSI